MALSATVRRSAASVLVAGALAFGAYSVAAVSANTATGETLFGGGVGVLDGSGLAVTTGDVLGDWNVTAGIDRGSVLPWVEVDH